MPAKKSYDELPPADVDRFLMRSETREDMRLIGKIYSMGLDDEKREVAFRIALANTPDNPRDRTCLKFLWARSKGDNAFATRQYASAIQLNDKALRVLFDGEARYLRSEYYNEDYIALFQPLDSWKLHMDLVAACATISQSYEESNDFCKQLEWAGEVEVLYGCVDLRFARESDTSYKTYKYFVNNMKMKLQLACLFTRLENTASAAFYAEKGRSYKIQTFLYDFREVQDLNNSSRSRIALWMRHPDLKKIDSWDIVDSRLQVRGIWNKLVPCSSYRPRKRRGSLMWIWRSTLYVFGGVANTSQFKSHPCFDIWCINLKTLEKWRRLPSVPERYLVLGLYASKAVVYDNYAWIFTGQRDILRFDMEKESWDNVSTKMSDEENQKWPYNDKGLTDPSIALLDHFLYVFGGDLHFGSEGTAILMVLDLKMKRWRILGDSSSVKKKDYPGKYWPPPRCGAGCWIVPHEKRLYLLYGTRKLKDDRPPSEKIPAHDPYYSDFWSYSIEDETWVRERVRGNYPCPREDMAIIYHPGLNSVIFFGGLNQSMHSYTYVLPDLADGKFPIEEAFPDTTYTVFGDTFVLSMEDRTWRQVVTRSFPGWITSARCVVDVSTGDTFLYGGCSYKEFVNREHVELPNFCFFTDIYRLDIDLPESRFQVDKFLAGDLNLKFGSWRRCYTCKNIGKDYRKCHGTCGGKYIYCSVECQRKAWQEHRQIHGCRKMYSRVQHDNQYS